MERYKISPSLKLLLATRRYGLASKFVGWDEDATEAKIALALSILRGDHDWFYRITELWDPYYCSDIYYIDKADPERSDPLWFLLRCHGDIGYRGLDWRYLPLYRYSLELLPHDPFLIWAVALSYEEKNSMEPEALKYYAKAIDVQDEMLWQYDSRDLLMQDENFSRFSWFCDDLKEVLGFYLWEAGRFPSAEEVHRRCHDRLIKARFYKEDLTEEDVQWLGEQVQKEDCSLLTKQQKVRIYQTLAQWSLKEGRVDFFLMPILEEGNRYLSLWDKPKVEALLGRSYLREHQWEKAVYWLQRANWRQKNDSLLALYLARAFLAWYYGNEKEKIKGKRQQIFQDCRQAWLEVLALKDHELEALMVLAELAEIEGTFHESENYYEQALLLLQQDSYSTDDSGRFYLNYSLLLYRMEKTEVAEAMLQQGATFWYEEMS
ncbi:tetratricopeptide repeat protein [Heliorestis convoluta]|uniref:Serine/threonine protein kinase n=1 Tax=Heliorestis convoluta TaxID=356322 RepID=A0A5Q2N5M9_9FIRM|nr:hypothetical protein [Heliorestis convoluta]QGG47550.1 serine/threonine protein kinase [Heliorestis convoluta]